MWHTLLLGGTASIFLAMTAAALFHLRWARRLPSIGEFKPYDQNESSRGNVIARALLVAEREGADHITLTPGVAPETPGGRAWHLAFLMTLADWISGVNRDRPKRYLGLGAFNLVRVAAYRECGGYEALRLTVLDDVKLGLLLRRAGKRTRAFIGGNDA